MKKRKFFQKLHMPNVVALFLAMLLFFNATPLYAANIAGGTDAGAAESTTGGKGSGTTESSTESKQSTEQKSTLAGSEEAYGKSLKRSKYGKLYYDYVAEGNIIPATTLFVGTYLIDARALNASAAEQMETAKAEADNTAAGKENVKKGISGAIYQKALQSMTTYNQKTRYYRSELADGEWRDISEAGKLEDILKTARVVPKKELDPLVITCVVGADGIPRDPDGNEMNIFDYPNPYEMDEIPELKPIQEYYNSGKVSDKSAASDNYRYWRLYYFFNHDNIPTFDRYATSQLLIDRTYLSLTEDSSGKKLEDMWDEAEVRNDIPKDENQNFKETVRNWPNARDSVTNYDDVGLDTTYKLYLSLKKKGMDDEAEEALKIAEALDAERRAEVFYNLTKNSNILLNSRLKEIDDLEADLDAEIAALNAEADEIRTVELPALQQAHADMEAELEKSLDAAEKAEKEIADAAAKRQAEATAAAEQQAAAQATGDAAAQTTAEPEKTTAAESAAAAAEEEAKDLTRLETLYERLSRYSIFKGKLEDQLEKLKAQNQLAPLAVTITEELRTIQTLKQETIPDLERKIPYGNQQVDRLTTEKKELESTLKDAQERERFTLEKTLKARIADNETMTKAYQNAVKEAETQLAEAKELLQKTEDELKQNLQALDALSADTEEEEVRTDLKKLSDSLSAMTNETGEEEWTKWGEDFSKASAAASALQEKKNSETTAKSEEIASVTSAIEAVNKAIESRKEALAADLAANEKKQTFVQERLQTIEDQIKYKKEAVEERKKEKTFYEGGLMDAAEKAELGAEIADLKAERSKLEREKKLLEEQVPPLESEYTAIKADLDKVNAEKAELDNQLAALKAELAALSEGKDALEARDRAINEEVPKLQEEKKTHPQDAYKNDAIYQQLIKEKESLEARKKEAETTGIREARLADFNRWAEKEATAETSAQKQIKDDALSKLQNESELQPQEMEALQSHLDPLKKMYDDLKGNTRTSFEKLPPLVLSAGVNAALFEKEPATSLTRLRLRRLKEESAEQLERQRENVVVSTRRQIQRGASVLNNKGEEELAVEKQIEELGKAIESTDQRIKEETERIENEIVAWDKLQDQKIASLKEEKTKIAEELTRNTAAVPAKEEEIKAKEAEVEAKAAEVAPVQEKADAKQKEIEAKQKDISDMDQRIDAIQDQIVEKQKQYDAIDANVNANVTKAEFSIGPTLEFLSKLAETGQSDQGRTYTNMSAYRGDEYIEDSTLTAAIGEATANSNAAYVSYRDKTINRGEQVYENLRYQYSRKVIDAGIDETEALPNLRMLQDLGNVYYNEDVVHKERELTCIDETLLPRCLGRLEAVKEPKTSLSDYDLNRDIEEYQTYLQARTDRDTVNNSIAFLKNRITYAKNLKKSAKDWSQSRIDEHIDWLNRLLATLNSDIDDSDKSFEELDKYIAQLEEEERKRREEDNPKEAKKIEKLRKEKEAEKGEMIDNAIDPNLSTPDLLGNLNRIGGKPKVEDDLIKRTLSKINSDDYDIDTELEDLAGIGADLSPVIDGLNNKGAPDDIKNKAAMADANSRNSPLYGYNNSPPDPGSGNRGEGTNLGDSTSGGTNTGGEGGAGSGNGAGGGSNGRGSGVGVDRGSLNGNEISDAIKDVFGDDPSKLSDADMAAILAALAKYGKEFGDDPVLAYAMSLLEELLGKGGANGFIYRQYQADPATEYVSFGSIDMTRAYSFYRYTHKGQDAILQQILGGSASYAFQIGSDAMKDNTGTEYTLVKPAVSQEDTYLHGNADTLYPYITREDSEQYMDISCVYMPGKDWAILVPPSLKEKMAELTEKLTQAAQYLESNPIS